MSDRQGLHDRSQLFLEYARVVRLCEESEQAIDPRDCCKWKGKTLLTSPVFTDPITHYEFAIAINNGYPYFISDQRNQALLEG